MKKILFLLILSILSHLYAEYAVIGGESFTAQSAVLMDFENGRVLFDKNGNDIIPPASMTKIMTLFLAYDAIAEGQIHKDDMIIIDEAGSSFSRPPFSSLMLLEEGQIVSVLDIMKGLAISSGNDAAYAIADIVAGSPAQFVRKMNDKAESLGLEDCFFVDPDGWSELNQVSARSFAQLAKAYIENYPEALEELHSIPFLVYPLPENMPEGEEFRIQVPRKKKNTNILLGKFEGIDGLKTGYIDESGFNFTGTAKRGDQRLIAVIMGIHSENYIQGLKLRASECQTLLEYGFELYELRTPLTSELPPLRLWYSAEEYIQPAIADDVSFYLSETETQSVYTALKLEKYYEAPFTEGQILGQIEYYLDGFLLGTHDLVSPQEYKKGSLFQRIRDWFQLKWMEFRS